MAINPMNIVGKAAKVGAGAAVVGTGAVIAEQATDKGAGGIVSNFIPKVWEKFTETSSPEQGRNSLLDNFFAGNARFAGFMGFISSLVSFFSPAMGKKIDNWLVQRSERVSEISKDLAENGTGRDTPASPNPGSPANTLDQAAAAVQNALPEGIDGTDVALGAAALGGGAYALKKGFGAAASAAGPTTLSAAPAVATSLGGRALNALLGTTTLGKAVRAAAVIGTVGAASVMADDSNSVDPAASGAAPATPAAAAAVADPAASAPATTTPATAAPATPAAPAEVSLLENPLGFLGNMGEGVSSLVKERPDGGIQVDWANVGDAVQNNAKAAAVGFTSTGAWLGGQAVDLLDSTENFLGMDFIESTPDTDFSTSWSTTISEGTQGLMNEYVPGGAPDMSGAWAQTFSFAGGMAAGGTVAKGLGVGARLSSIFKWNAAGNAPATAAPAATATPRLGM